MGVIVYSSNNSGGDWWLKDEDWKALEKAGWVVHWNHSHDVEQNHSHDKDKTPSTLMRHYHLYEDELVPAVSNGDRWLDALATSAAKETDNPGEAISEWESVTGMVASDEGCNCCGPPHTFTFTDNEGNKRWTTVEVVETKLNWS